MISFSIGPNDKPSHYQVLSWLFDRPEYKVISINFDGDHYSEIYVNGDYNLAYSELTSIHHISIEHWEE